MNLRPARPPAGASPAGGSLLDQMRARLSGGRFRWLNEALYTSGGGQALAMVQAQPELMDQYHEGGWLVGCWLGGCSSWWSSCWVGWVATAASRLAEALLCPAWRSPPDVLPPPSAGFREQTRGWPVQPVDQAIRWLRGRPPSWVVADLGCGDAQIAATVQQVGEEQGRGSRVAPPGCPCLRLAALASVAYCLHCHALARRPPRAASAQL